MRIRDKLRNKIPQKVKDLVLGPEIPDSNQVQSQTVSAPPSEPHTLVTKEKPPKLLPPQWPQNIVDLEEWMIAQEEFVRLLQLSRSSCDENRIRILVRLGSFHNIIAIWDIMEQRILQNKQCTDTDLEMLHNIVALFNEGQHPHSASLLIPAQGDTFQSHLHRDQSNNYGQKVQGVLLPGLYNITQTIKKKAWVSTQ